MENKYYTPKIEEFRVGFEYEVFQEGQPYDPNVMYLMPPQTEDTWYKFKFPDPFLGYNLDRMFKTYTMRTKYLDREDIESLEFKVLDENLNTYKFEKHTLKIRRLDNVIYVSIYEEVNGKLHVTLQGYKVKNKFEFKDILEKLSII